METKHELQSKIDGLLAKPHLDATQRKQVDGLLSKLADLRADEGRAAQAKAVLAEMGVSTPINENEDEFRSAKYEAAFSRYVKRGNADEIRTYVPMTTAGIPLSQGFLSAYREALKSSSGIREAGATVISTVTGDPLKNPFLNDTSNTGELLNENDTSSLANPTFSDVVFSAFRYGSKGLKYSAQLFSDSGLDVTTMLATTFGKRIARLTNNHYTLGNVSAMTGVIPSITNVATSTTATAVSLQDLVDLQGEIDPAYLPGSVYMLNPKSVRTLRKMLGTDGRRLFPEMGQGMLLGYPYVLNVDMADIASTNKAIAFGNFSAVTIREVLPTLLVSAERYAESHSMYAVLMAASDCQVVDANALAVLQQTT